VLLIINCESAIIPHHLSAHKALNDQGILHRNICAGNILLTKTQNGPLRGFITDLKFARIASSSITSIGPQNRYDDRGRLLSVTEPTTRAHTTFESTVTFKRGAGMTVNYFDKDFFSSTLKIFLGNGSIHGESNFTARCETYRARSSSRRRIFYLGTLILCYAQPLSSGFSTILATGGPPPVPCISIRISPSVWPNHSQTHCQ
jgi:hypothetical protein